MTAADKIKAMPLPEPFFPKRWPGDTDGLSMAQVRALIDAAAAIAARQDAVMAQMVEAASACADLAWTQDSHSVRFDSTVMFGPGYDFSGLDGPSREEFHGAVECIVWPSGVIGPRKWSAYCTHDGSLWFERFDTAAEAKEACMRLLDRVLPGHPAMKFRAALRAHKEME